MSINKNRVDTTIWDKFKLDEGYLSLLTLWLAFMTVVWSIQSGNWLEGLYVLTWAGIFGFAIGFALSRIRFVPSLLAHSFMLSVGMVVTGLLVAPFVNIPFADWSKKLGSAVLRVVKWCENAINGNAREDSLVYLIFLALAIWTLGYMVAWFVFRLNVVWPALAMLAAALMINLSFNPPNATAAFVFFLLNALLLVIRFSAFQNELRWRSLRMYFPGGIWRNALGVGGFLALLILAVAFVTPSQSGYKTLGDVISNVTTPFNDFKGIWDNIGTGGTGSKGDQLTPRSNANYNSLDDSFTIGGPLKLSNDPVFRVSADGGLTPAYLQGKTMDFYDGKGWVNSYQTTADGKLANNEAAFRRLSLAANQSLPTPPNAGQGSTRLNVTSLVPGFTPVLSLGDLVSVDRPALVAFHYEKIALNAPLDAFKLKESTDGNGGKRSVLVDERTGDPVPPSALELIRLVSEAANSGQFGYPNKLTAFYTKRANEWQVQYQFGNERIQGFNNRNSQNGQALVVVRDNWRYTLPGVQDLIALNMQPGSAPNTGKIASLRVTTQQNQDMPIEMNMTLYLNTAGVYRLEIESPMAKDNNARNLFESSEIGKKIATEVKRIEEAVKGNNVEIVLENGRPARLLYNGFEPNYDDLTGGVLVQGLNQGENYSATARRYRADIQSLRRVGQTYPSWVRERYLKMPEGQTAFYRKLAEELTAGLSNPYDKAKAIESYLNSFTYTTEPPAPPTGQDEIQFFLSESKTGYCVHFSSAMALMLRSIGIPTRLTTGFISGEFDQTTNSWVVKGSAAHAWTQVYFPGYGWIDFEPTPGREGIQRPADPSAVPPLPTPTPAPEVSNPEQTNPALQPTPTPVPASNPLTNPLTTGQPTSQNGEFPWWILWLLAAGGLVGGAVYLRHWYIQQQLALPDPSPLTVYQRMSQSARKAGLRGRKGMTPYEYAAYLGKRVPSAKPSIEVITEAYVRRRYGPEALEEYRAERERNNPPDDLTTATTLPAAPARAGNVALLERVETSQEVSEQQMRTNWRDYQLAVMSYRRQRLQQRIVPKVIKKR